MTEARVGTPASAVTGDWLSIERSTTTKPEGVIATVVITSASPTPVGVRVRQGLPDAWAVTGVSLHPDHEPPEFTAAADAIEFADVVYPDERRRFVYGIRIDTTDGLEPLGDPEIVEERQLEARIGQPDDGVPTDGSVDPQGAGEGPTADLWDDAGPDAVAAEPPASADDEETGGADDPAAEPSIDDAPALFEDSSAAPGTGDAAPDRPEDDPGPFGPDPPPDPPVDPDLDPVVENGTRDAVTDDGDGEPADAAEPDADAPAEDGDADTGGVAGDGGLLAAPETVLEETANLLVLADHDEAGAGCSRLLERQIEAGDELVLVTFAESADDRLEAVTGLAAVPGSIDLLCMGDPQRSNAADGSTVSTPAGEVAVTSITDATDLFRLGVHISRALDEASGEAVLCFHSLTALVGLVELHRVFRFLHVLSGRVRGADARGHYHLDPSVIDEQTYGTLGHLFDDVVRFEDGHWAVD